MLVKITISLTILHLVSAQHQSFCCPDLVGNDTLLSEMKQNVGMLHTKNENIRINIDLLNANLHDQFLKEQIAFKNILQAVLAPQECSDSSCDYLINTCSNMTTKPGSTSKIVKNETLQNIRTRQPLPKFTSRLMNNETSESINTGKPLPSITSRLMNNETLETVNTGTPLTSRAHFIIHSTLESSPTYCTKALQNGGHNGVYEIDALGSRLEPFNAYCLKNLDDETKDIDGDDSSPWMVIQRRLNGSVDFYRSWSEYQRGFGNLMGEFFIGMDKLHVLTRIIPHELWIQLEDFEGEKRWAKYSSLTTGADSESYALLTLGSYSGDAKDALKEHVGKMWSTRDMDNDIFELKNCARMRRGAWWFHKCGESHLNGQYLEGGKTDFARIGDGIQWHTWKGEDYSLKSVHMAIRPVKLREKLLPTNCAEALGTNSSSGVYKIKLPDVKLEPFSVYCQKNIADDAKKIDGDDSSPWMVIQRRHNGSENFFRNWAEYQQGFGNVAEEFFIGLDRLHELTQSTLHELWIQLADFEGEQRWAKYSSFSIGAEGDKYKLKTLGSYSGDAEDALRAHVGKMWSTNDVDNDNLELKNCAQMRRGAWWFHKCAECHLNGQYLEGGTQPFSKSGEGIQWQNWKGEQYSLKSAQMAIRPVHIVTNCVDAMGENGPNGVYKIEVPNSNLEPFNVYCLNVLEKNIVGKDSSPWMVIHRRQEGSIDFYRNWTEYQSGFGNLEGEFFIGLEKLYALTNSKLHELWIQLEDFEGEQRWAKYISFIIGAESDAYILKILGTYGGDAGDALRENVGRKWSTKDVDNDNEMENCAQTHKGAWWYSNCGDSNLNGLYMDGKNIKGSEKFEEGIQWKQWHGAQYSLRYVQMAIRPVIPTGFM